MNIKDKIIELFAENKQFNKEDVKNELSAMRSSQPPNNPTFMVGQQDIKERLQQQFIRCLYDESFSYAVIVGEVGGGKTHLLNLIKSKFINDQDYYVVQFRAEETDEVQYSFPKMIVVTLFRRYYDEFKEVFASIDVNNIINEYEEDEVAYGITSYLKISVGLAEVIYQYILQGDKKNSSMRILGGCENSRDIVNLKINKLTDKDYMDVIQIFLQHKKRKNFLLIMLDEFEHSCTLFTPAKRRNFLKGYKAYIDTFAKSESCPMILITAATVQYKGQLKERLDKIDTALSSRLEPHTLMLDEFSIADDKNFEILYKELALRYKEAYGYDIGENGAVKMRKKVFQRWEANSAKKITYRDVITAIIIIMDEMERKKERFEEMNKIIEKELVSSIKVVQKEQLIIANDEYEKLKKESEKEWDERTKSRISLIKKGVENLLENYIEDFQQKKIGLGRQGTSAICFKDQNTKKLIYVALQDIADKLNSCEKMKEEQQKGQDGDIVAYFMYIPGEDIEELLRNYPDIIPINIDLKRLDLITLGRKSNLELGVKKIILEMLKELSEKLIGRGIDKNE